MTDLLSRGGAGVVKETTAQSPLAFALGSRASAVASRGAAFARLAAAAAVIAACALPASAQFLKKGMAVATCFSGIKPNTNTPDPDGFVLAALDVRNGAAPTPPFSVPAGTALFGDHLVADYHHPKWTARYMGQVFGLAIDTQGNIFTAASTVYGDFRPGQTGPFVAGMFPSTALPSGLGDSGTIYRIDGTTGDPDVWVKLPTNPSNPGLGNLAYDPLFNQIFVTNLHDGQIYRIKINSNGSAGTPVAFNPFTGLKNSPNLSASSGFVQRGSRPWGIAVYRSRLYFANWAEDGFRSGGSRNAIYPISLDPSNGNDFVTGNFLVLASSSGIPGSAVIVFDTDNVPGVSSANPVSDIELSGDGARMLVAERTHLQADRRPAVDTSGNLLVNTGGWAHRSRVLEYVGGGLTWSKGSASSPWRYSGEQSLWAAPANSSGGVDFAYGSYNQRLDIVEQCELYIWSTGDCLGIGGCRVYGLHGTYSATNTTVNSDDYLVDLDHTYGTADKTQIGDVDVFRDPCADCMSIVRTEIECLENGTYSIIVKFVNNNPFHLTAENLTVTLPDGTTTIVKPVPAQVLPGQMGTATINLPGGGTAGQTVGIKVQLAGKATGSALLYCCPEETINVVLPECRCFRLSWDFKFVDGKLVLVASVTNNLIDPQATYAEVSVVSPASTTISPSTVNLSPPISLGATGPLGQFTVSPLPPAGQTLKLSVTLFGKRRQLNLYELCCTEKFEIRIPRFCTDCQIAPHWSGGVVFLDRNGNGVFDSGEQPIRGQEVILGSSAGRAVSAVTDELGEYYFTNLTPGEEYLTIVRNLSVPGLVSPAAGYRFRLEEGGSTVRHDFAIAPPAGTSTTTTVTTGVHRTNFSRKLIPTGDESSRPVELPEALELPPGRHTIESTAENGEQVLRQVIVRQ